MKRIASFLLIACAVLIMGCPNAANSTNNANETTTEEKLAMPFYNWALEPPMGWNSWDCFGPNVTEAQVKANADYMAANLKEFGWEYIVVDIRWYVSNQTSGNYISTSSANYVLDEWGRYMPGTGRFPSAANGVGFKALADYVHSKGLKFGIHIMRGIPIRAVSNNLPIKGTDNIRANQIYSTALQCEWLKDNWTIDSTKPGAQEYYDSIFELYASWGVDFIKIDDLSRPYHKGEIELIRNAIDKCGRPIVLSTSPGETPVGEAEHVKTHANMWRMVDDVWDRWSDITHLFNVAQHWWPSIGTGHYPDCDMIPFGRLWNGRPGNTGTSDTWCKFTNDEMYTMMTLFTIFRSPLMFGGHMPDNTAFINSLLTNNEALYVNKKSKNNKLLYNENGVIAYIADDSQSSDKFLALFYTDGFDKNKALFSQTVTRNTPGHGVSIDVPIRSGSTVLYLIAGAGEDTFHYDWADWINPKLYRTSNGAETLLTSLNWANATTGWSDRLNKITTSGTLRVNGAGYSNGIATHAESVIQYNLTAGYYNRFTAFAGLDNGGTDQARQSYEDPSYGSKVDFMVFDTDISKRNVTIDLAKMGIKGKAAIRDLWKKQDMGEFSGTEFAPELNIHGAGLYRLSPVK